MGSPKGKVYLVGAGPGDPDLLTIKAARILGRADVVLHDELVNSEILALAPAAARIENVGKRCGRARIAQAEIHSKLVAFASEGATVVRLKGGDPLLFGRAGEEMQALREAGIDFEIVPGISAAFGAAAAARIPLTDRRHASKLVFLTNHRCEEKSAAANTGAEDTTAVVYMPGRNYGELMQTLAEMSFGPDTPCLVVSCATSALQQICSSRLADLPGLTSPPAPALLIVGSVAGNYLERPELAEGLIGSCLAELTEKS